MPKDSDFLHLLSTIDDDEVDLLDLLKKALQPATKLARTAKIGRLLAQISGWLPAVLEVVPPDKLEAVLDRIACSAPKDNPQLQRCAATLRDWLLAEMEYHRAQIVPSQDPRMFQSLN